MPGIFTDRELALLRREADEFLGGYAITVMREPSDDPESEPTPHLVAEPGFYAPEETKEVVRGGTTQVVTQPAVAWFRHGTDITEADFINRVVDQLGVVHVDEALFISRVDRLDSHIEVTLSGTRA